MKASKELLAEVDRLNAQLGLVNENCHIVRDGKPIIPNEFTEAALKYMQDHGAKFFIAKK